MIHSFFASAPHRVLAGFVAATFLVSTAPSPRLRAADWWKETAGQPVFQEKIVGMGTNSSWRLVAGKFTVSDDKDLGRQILTATGGDVSYEGRTDNPQGVEIRARVRLRTDASPGAYMRFYVAKKDEKDPGIMVLLSANAANETINCQVFQNGKPIQDPAAEPTAVAAKLNWPANGSSQFLPNHRPYARIEPGWPEEFRALIERDLGWYPDHNRQWQDLRVELKKGLVRVWLNDRAVAEKRDEGITGDGLTRLDLNTGVQLSGLTVGSLSEQPGFLPIRLDGYVNARDLLREKPVKRETLPPSDKPVVVEGVPFLFPGTDLRGNDHLDLSQSLYRQAAMEGYFPVSGPAWAGAALADRARIQIRIPNRQFNALYLIAGASGEEHHVPVVTAMFYRPGAGFSEQFESKVPLATAKSSDAKALPVELKDGRKVTLWLVKIPLDPGKLSAFADMDLVEVELTKKVHQFRSYPDPFIYGWHQGGPPSSVQIYAATLGEVPVGYTFEPDRFGHVWTAPEVPSYTATLTNRTGSDLSGKLTVKTRSHDGTEEIPQEKPVTLAKGATANIAFTLPVKLNGYHDIWATLSVGGKEWTEKRSFVRLAPDTRSPKWTGKGALFGYWSYGGGHYTPNLEHHVRLMTLAGARTGIGYPVKLPPEVRALVDAHWSPTPAGAWEVSPQPWALEEPLDPKKVAEFQATIIKNFHTYRDPIPADRRPDHVYFYPEPHISPRLTSGNSQEEVTRDPLVYTPEEKERIKLFFNTSKIAAEAVRKEFPDLKILIPWGDPGFAWPILRAGFPKELIDGSGIDIPGFERIPERQLHEQSIHRLSFMKPEFVKAGVPNPQLQFCEGIFVPTEPGAVSWREQMDIYHRWALISMAHGVRRFYSGWFAFDCGSYYGAEHYGGCGIQRRIPYCDPKPAYAAYATMTDKLNDAEFDGWVKTGSLTTYCLRFKGPKGNVYALWTLRGQRPVTLTLAADGKVGITDSMNNTKEVTSKNKQFTVMTDPSVIYITGAGEIASASVGSPDNSDAVPSERAREIANLGDGSWKYTSKRDELYEKNHWGISPAAGKFSSVVADDPGRKRVLVSKLEKQEKVRELMPWYSILKPDRPIRLEGAPSHLGLWVKGASDWGRVIYVLRDDKGERWTGIGTKDDYNADDVHSWSSFNFDGWRYLRFELPGHLGWDSFRKHGTTWWGSHGGDKIVDLPLQLEEIIVEQRSHILYVNDVQPVASDTVSFGTLHVEYESPEDATEDAVRLSRLRMPMPEGEADLPNPIEEMTKEGVGAPTEVTKLRPPDHGADGTLVHVHFKEVEGAKAYFVWVSAHRDGRGAVNMAPAGIQNGALVRGLRPAMKLYYWITWNDAQGKMSKPSPVHEEVLVDLFKEK